MATVFWICFGVGGIVLLLQVLLGLFGLGHDAPQDVQDIGHDLDHGGDGVDHGGDAQAAQGLNLLSVRPLAGGLAMFGAAGLTLNGAGAGPVLSPLLAIVPGYLMALGTAWLTRKMMSLESDGSLRLENAVGAAGNVYLSIPSSGNGFGKVLFPLQGRTVELRAVTSDPEPIPSGTSITVVGVVDAQTVEVTLTPTFEA